jgi:hypothetical protein
VSGRRSCMRWLLAVACLAACERAGDEAVEKVAEKAIADGGRESSVTIDRERRSITIDLGSATRPKRWPDDVPFYPKARRARADQPDGDKQRLTLRSGDRAEEVKSFYRDELIGNGWTVEDAKETLRARKSGRELVARFQSKDPVRGTHAVIEIRAPRG